MATETATDIDPVTLEVIWSRLRGISEEIGTHLQRTAFSEVIKYGDDLSTGLFTRDGRLVAQGVFTPGHLGTMPFSMQKLLAEHFDPGDWEPGDVVLFNEPYIGAGHLPDFIMVEPVFHDGGLMGYVLTEGNVIDVGGAVAGSFSVHTSEVHQEGILIPPIKYYEGGERNEEIFEVILGNSRVPRKMRGDVEAMRGATRVGRERFAALIDDYGPETAQRYMDEICDRTEQRMRNAIREVPNGVYTFEDQLDGFEEPLPICLELTVTDDEFVLDFEGTADAQGDYAINSAWNYTFSYVMQSIKSAIDPDTPPTAGTFRPVTLDVPEGSLLNAQHPDPVAARHLCANRIVSTVNGALHQSIPEKIPAAGSQLLLTSIGITDEETGESGVFLDMYYGGAGARPERDGYPSISAATNVQNIPVEVIEQEFPIAIQRYQLEPDTAGAGRYQGGSGTIREYRFGADADLQFVNERFKFGQYGLSGGEVGKPGAAVIHPDTEAAEGLSAKEQLSVEDGDVIRIRTPGGGGYGDPTARDEAAVHEDLADGVITPEFAAEHYAVDE